MSLVLLKNAKTIYGAITEIAGSEYVSDDLAALYAYTKDASIFGGTEASLVVRPGSTEEVSKIMVVANENNVSVVVRGGGASIYGQPAGASGKNLLIDMTRMNKIVSLNKNSMNVTAQSGIMMGKLQYECKKEGFYIFSPFSPLHIVTLGGWISGTAGSAGLWTDIIGLQVVLTDGKVVTTGGGPGTNINQPLFYNRNLGGPDFTGLFIGDGGAFGVKTEATVRIFPYPSVMRASIVEFDNIDQVLDMVERHVSVVNPHPFHPIMVFGPGAMKNFMPEFEEITSYLVQGIMQGYDETEMDARLESFNKTADELGGRHNQMLDAMAETMAASSGGGESDMEMDWLSLFNGLGLAAWLPFTLPREGFKETLNMLMKWRADKLNEAEAKGFVCNATWEFFVPTDNSTLIGEIDVFFNDTYTSEIREYIRKMMADFQDYAHSLGSIDVYNQGIMTHINSSCWSEGFKQLYTTVKTGFDPKGILNPGLWKNN